MGQRVVPARLTALGFAVVGDFEGAVYCWRQAARTSSTFMRRSASCS